jgi:predicted Fe-Mo cluster-binding NifX family protein
VNIVALPIYQSRIAPVFDSAVRILLIQIEQQSEVARSELNFENLSASERIASLKRAGVTSLVCAGVSHVIHTMVESAGIRVTPGIIGQVDDVTTAYVSNQLDDHRFRMPGRGGRSEGVTSAIGADALFSDSSIRRHTNKHHNHGQRRG